MKKILLSIVGVVVVLIAGIAVFVATMLPKQRPASTEKIEATPQRLARGEYLVKNVAGCLHCHSGMQTDIFGLPAIPGHEGEGGTPKQGMCLDEAIGFPGEICAANITSDPETGIGAWTDGEVLRALREGISRDGHALFPTMPYLHFAGIGDEDAKSVVAFIRTLAPVKHQVRARRLNPPVNVIVRLMPKPLEGPVAGEPDHGNPVAWGKYLTSVAACDGCHHTVDDKHQPMPGMEFAGGAPFDLPWGGKVYSANLTPHETGLGARTKEQFIGLFRAYATPEGRQQKVDPTQNTVMPWLVLSGMSDPELGAIYDYLRSLKPVDHAVAKRGQPTKT